MSAPASKRDLYRVETWGCQMNVLDGQRMAGQLEALGLSRAADGEVPSVVLLNTCAVREKAEAKVFSELGVLGPPQAARPGPRGRRDRLRRPGLGLRDPGAGAVGGLRRRHGPGRVRSGSWSKRPGASGGRPCGSSCRKRTRSTSSGRSRGSLPFQAYVTVIEGCEPVLHLLYRALHAGKRAQPGGRRGRRGGPARWRPEGFTEVTLLGQTVNAYREPEEGFGLGELLRRVARIQGIRRLRFLTSHPRFMDDEDSRDRLGATSSLPISTFRRSPARTASSRA